jgi:hypothetical protein
MSEHRLPTIVPRSIGASDRLKSALLGRMSRKRTFAYLVLTVAT